MLKPHCGFKALNGNKTFHFIQTYCKYFSIKEDSYRSHLYKKHDCSWPGYYVKKSKISEGADDDDEHEEDIVGGGEDEIINSKIDDVFVQQVEQEINTNERSAMND